MDPVELRSRKVCGVVWARVHVILEYEHRDITEKSIDAMGTSGSSSRLPREYASVSLHVTGLVGLFSVWHFCHRAAGIVTLRLVSAVRKATGAESATLLRPVVGKTFWSIVTETSV